MSSLCQSLGLAQTVQNIAITISIQLCVSPANFSTSPLSTLAHSSIGIQWLLKSNIRICLHDINSLWYSPQLRWEVKRRNITQLTVRFWIKGSSCWVKTEHFNSNYCFIQLSLSMCQQFNSSHLYYRTKCCRPMTH